MERRQLADTFVPQVECLSPDDVDALVNVLSDIRFLDFNDIRIRPVDALWAGILWGAEAENVLDEAYLYLCLMVGKRRG